MGLRMKKKKGLYDSHLMGVGVLCLGEEEEGEEGEGKGNNQYQSYSNLAWFVCQMEGPFVSTTPFMLFGLPGFFLVFFM